MGDDAGRNPVDADEAQPAEYVQAVGQDVTQLVFDSQTVLQQQHAGVRRSRLANDRTERGIAGALGADQQPVTRWHFSRRAIRLNRLEGQLAIHGAFDLQTFACHRVKLAAQQKMHIVSGTRQHQSVKPPMAPVPMMPTRGRRESTLMTSPLTVSLFAAVHYPSQRIVLQ